MLPSSIFISCLFALLVLTGFTSISDLKQTKQLSRTCHLWVSLPHIIGDQVCTRFHCVNIAFWLRKLFVHEALDINKTWPIGQVDCLELPEMPEITETIENFIKVTKHLTNLKETLTNYVWEKSHFKKQ